jgi:hypothetical protein
VTRPRVPPFVHGRAHLFAESCSILLAIEARVSSFRRLLNVGKHIHLEHGIPPRNLFASIRLQEVIEDKIGDIVPELRSGS